MSNSLPEEFWAKTVAGAAAQTRKRTMESNVFIRKKVFFYLNKGMG
jgi:hypothetical protein